MQLQETVLLLSFDVLSLFTKVPLQGTLQILTKHIPASVADLIRHILTTTYFLYDSTFYEQTDGLAMGSPLAPVIADICMEKFEREALRPAKKPAHWYRHVDDTFVVWLHGREALQEFLCHLNNIHNNIRFTMELEESGTLPFLDVVVKKRTDGKLSHTAFRKPTHTDLYLHVDSEHHLAQKKGVLSTLFHSACTICDDDNLQKQILHLRETFKKNGYSSQDIQQALHPKTKPKTESEKLVGVALIQYEHSTSNKIRKLRAKHKIKTVHIPAKKTINMISPVEDNLGLRTSGIYCIPCECGKVYVGQISRTIEIRRQ
jgi:hypothetical protein